MFAMLDNFRGRPLLCVLLFGAIAVCSLPLRAEESSDASTGTSNLQREYARLAQLLNSDDTFGKREAVDAFLKVRPSDVPDANTRKLIARGYRDIATGTDFFEKEKAIQGLAIWGGKYSVPILI